VDCIVAMPEKLFLNTGIPVCLWFLAKDRSNGRFRDRRAEILFIDARGLGRMTTRTLRVLDDGDVGEVARAYHSWRGEPSELPFADVAGFCRSVSLAEVSAHDFVLTPGRYVGAADIEADAEAPDEKLARLRSQLLAEFEESDRLQSVIQERLGSLLR
jgi:type I restriction enzyme M protein